MKRYIREAIADARHALKAIKLTPQNTDIINDKLEQLKRIEFYYQANFITETEALKEIVNVWEEK